MLEEQNTTNEGKFHERENYLQVPWVHLSREFLELAITIVKDNYETDNILGSIILEKSLDTL